MQISISLLVLILIGSFFIGISFDQIFADKDPHFKNLAKQNNTVNEDQVIICVIKADNITNDGYICHLYQSDKLDYYQDSQDGTFFNLNDSFDIEIKP